MREIKFRGKHIETGKWITGSLCHDPYSDESEISDHDDINLGREEVDRETVGQYTGLHDREDREIYEGDILFVEFADKSGRHYLVGWNERTASWGIMNIHEYKYLKEGDEWPEFKNHTLIAFLEHAIICEVVGNIHDNPELMNVPSYED